MGKSNAIRRSLQCVAILGIAIGSTGCIGVPFAIPPVEVAAGIGVGQSIPGPDMEPGASTKPAWQLRGAIHPLQLWPSQLERHFDFGIGYGIDQGPLRLHGPHVEASLSPWVEHTRSGSVVRVSLRAQGRLVVTPENAVGSGGALQLAVELARFYNGSLPLDGFGVGKDYGEASIGGYVEAAAATAPGWPSMWSVTAGLIMRLPASVGLVFVAPWSHGHRSMSSIAP